MHNLFEPSSVCLIGASADPTKLAGKTLSRLEQHSFPGKIHLVNPRRTTIGDRVCHPSVAAVGEPIDVALISLPAAAVPGAIRECGEIGVGFAVVISSGFDEDVRSGSLAQELADAVADSGVRLVGPNCEGIWSTPAGMALTFGSAADRPELLSGTVSLISQSGSIGGAALRALQNAGVGCRYFVSSGNEADLTAMDYLEHFVDEGGSDVIAMFVEGFRDGHRLRDIALKANAAGIRLVALCSGTSELGRQATASHTGRISSASAVYRDLLATAGVVQVESFAGFVDAIKVASLGGLPDDPRGDGDGVGVLAFSGGSRALLADACSGRGVPMARFSKETEAAIEALLPEFGYAKNPADLTGEVASNANLFAAVIGALADDGGVESIVVQYANAADRQLLTHIDVFNTLLLKTDAPIIVSTLGAIDPKTAARLREIGVITATDPAQSVRQLEWLYTWRDAGRAASQRPRVIESPLPVPETFFSDASWTGQMGLLAEAGIPVPRWHIVDAGDDVNEIDLAFPVVVKATPEFSEHKTEAGLVFLNVADREALRSVLAEYRRRAGVGVPALVQEMVSGQTELLLTARTDSDFGPLLVLGAGGVTTEWERDVVHIQLPATRDEIHRGLQRLRIWPLLQQFRGRPACDIDAIVVAAHSLGATFVSRFPAGAEIEINPLLAGPAPGGVTAVDVLCTWPDN